MGNRCLRIISTYLSTELLVLGEILAFCLATRYLLTYKPQYLLIFTIDSPAAHELLENYVTI